MTPRAEPEGSIFTRIEDGWESHVVTGRVGRLEFPGPAAGPGGDRAAGRAGRHKIALCTLLPDSDPRDLAPGASLSGDSGMVSSGMVSSGMVASLSGDSGMDASGMVSSGMVASLSGDSGMVSSGMAASGMGASDMGASGLGPFHQLVFHDEHAEALAGLGLAPGDRIRAPIRDLRPLAYAVRLPDGTDRLVPYIRANAGTPALFKRAGPPDRPAPPSPSAPSSSGAPSGRGGGTQSETRPKSVRASRRRS